MTVGRPIVLLILLSTLGGCRSKGPRVLHRALQRRRRWNEERQRSKKQNVGTIVTFRRPTEELACEWFRDDAADFNHKTAGMTNPSLTVSVNDQLMAQVSTTKGTVWWPAVTPISKEWRVLLYRCRVGFGKACYERVRDASLSWEFSSPPLLGMVAAQSSNAGASHMQPIRQKSSGCGFDIVCSSQGDYGSVFEDCQFARAVYTGRGRRLVTYTRAFASRFMPRLFVVNPVRLVYEMVDERAPDPRGSTYTASAYATLQGHWLCGEERMTVVLRDEGHVDVEILSHSKASNTLFGRLIWPFVAPRQDAFFRQQMEAIQRIAAPIEPPKPRVMPLIEKIQLN